ncbi:uncharacterized protein METZ01_LOCUS409633, partial [marine metagenome]
EGDTDNAAFSVDGNSLKLNALADSGAKETYTVRVEGTDSGGLAFARSFTLTNTNHAPTGSVTITGTPKEDEALTAGNDLADEDIPGAIRYQWNRDGVAIDGSSRVTIISTEGASPAYSAGREFDKAWDGMTGTFFDYKNASGGWTQGNFAESFIHRLEYFPRNWVWDNVSGATRMEGGSFIGVRANGDEVLLHTIPAGEPKDRQWTSVTLPANVRGNYVAVKYQSPAASNGNVAEINVWSTHATTLISPAAPFVAGNSLELYYNFDEGSGTVARDISG